MSNYNLIGYSPLMLDVCAECKLKFQDYISLLSDYNLQIGGRLEVKTTSDFNNWIKLFTGESLDLLLKTKGYFLGGGILASFAAFSTDYQFEASLTIFDSYNCSLIKDIFYNELYTKFFNWNKLTVFEGCIICLSLHHADAPERTFIVLKNIYNTNVFKLSGQLNTLTWISIFELNDGFFFINLPEISKNKYPFIVSLGDKDLLNDKIKQLLFSLVESGCLKYLFGNADEFKKMFSKEDYEDSVFFEYMRLESASCCTMFLITNGEKGMVAIYNGSLFYEPATPNINIVNTNGAGDAAAGGFISTYLTTNDISKSLSFAREQADRVLSVNSPVL
ncbi:PfkB family carbohydrate kinase [Runella sp. SP2]|uniref:PfkB family carbohydrate kinase n=1 Tax=Runella sp. SP2 TaxID=2268026 RepID=UPI000F0854FA|nr:PfkB family carbohydrate kinase [Runella sp. SP2]AYQ31186.1 hypothetical protein DTQ70_02890 [Runella sp. SP2]